MSAQEQIQLPELCSKCLGDSPSLTLLRDLKGEQCRLCTQPFATFSWRKRKSGPKEISRFCTPCAKRKNVCQSCYRNFATGLPLSVHESASGLVTNTAPQALKYAAVKAETQIAAETSKQAYDNRLEQHTPQLAIQNQEPEIVTRVREVLIGAAQEPDRAAQIDPDASTFFVANVTLELDPEAIKAKLARFGTVTLKTFPQARCGFVTFETAEQAQRAISKLTKGIFMVDQTKLRLVWSSPMQIDDSERQVAVLVQQFMRGNLT